MNLPLLERVLLAISECKRGGNKLPKGFPDFKSLVKAYYQTKSEFNEEEYKQLFKMTIEDIASSVTQGHKEDV